MKKQKSRNRLNKEHSPYLLQHAGNPVDWYPWCDEAFERARREHKPVFLSIGYATCHWCHVMARESFEDTEIAALMNRAFVCVKVDREERPDIDHLYMTLCHLMTGTGGWPLSLILTPDKKPFFAATYIPRDTRYGKKGLIDLIGELECAWRDKQDTIHQTTNQVQIALEHISHVNGDNALSQNEVHALYHDLKKGYDEHHGGFGSAPKFPSPHIFMFLLRYWYVYGEVHALRMAEHTLMKIRDGGIHDHVGGGFHRYATDIEWRVPHFEKILYDQALLMMAYAELYQVTRNDTYRLEVLGIADYVQNEMTAPEGGFVSAEDAESEGEEGQFYLWSYDEVKKILKRTAPVFCKAFGVLPEGNITDEATQKPVGRNVLYRIRSQQDPPHGTGSSRNIDAAIERSLEKLKRARTQRVRPAKDDKILTDWNGLMIAALAQAGRITGFDKLTKAACRAAAFIGQHLLHKNHQLVHRYYQNKAGITAHLDDYAFFIWGLIECYQTTFQLPFLEQALTMCDTMLAAFWDPGPHGGFFFTSVNSERLLIRQKVQYDSALPSGSSVAYYILQVLSAITGSNKYHRYIEQLERTMADPIIKNPTAYAFFVGSYLRNYDTPASITIIGDPDHASTSAIVRSLQDRFLPYAIFRLNPANENDPSRTNILPDFGASVTYPGHAIARVCTNTSCYEPTADTVSMLEQLHARKVVVDFEQ
ncbi:thioredoxin domain-containing protein [candidate division WOR-3 bacterium]|nr:thioredoxin domain-containing protein [candidate division WOR-3 bacterium]